MYKISVPVAMKTITRDSYRPLVKLLREMDVRRVFICCVGEVYLKDSYLYRYRYQIADL